MFPAKGDSLWLNVNLATMTEGNPYGMVKDGVLVVGGGKIVWLGQRVDLPADYKSRVEKTYDGQGGWITPGLVDCHTHLVYAGSRAREFELLLQGATYEEIARQGGGIRSTVAATREADEKTLLEQSAPRLEALMQEGATTVEVKSGYGLDLETELRMLRVARQLGEKYPVTVVPTYLGAHALPPEFEGRSDEYIDLVCNSVMPEVAAQKLAVALDAFCENIGFTPDQTEKVFQTAQKLGLAIKLHAEQLSDLKGASLAARYGALSADHLEYVSEEGIKAMAASGTVAVLLPGAFYFLRETRLPPIDLMRSHGVPIALSTDCNPGSSPTTSLLLMLNMACTLFRMTPEEALAGITRNGARALGLQDRIGTLEQGKDADFVLWDITEPAELAYRIGFNPLQQVVRQGSPISQSIYKPDNNY
ncbi:imidazolonepropionase [Thermodesulfobacteriota bacterium]